MMLRAWAVTSFLLLIGAWTASASAGEKMSVQVRKSSLRDKPNPLAKVVGSVTYGQRVDVLKRSGKAWIQIGEDKKVKRRAGWVRTSALTPKKLKVLASQAPGLVASAEEVALAEKGFDEKVEQVFKTKRNLGEAFAILDQVEKNPKLKKSPGDLRRFLEAGRVRPKS